MRPPSRADAFKVLLLQAGDGGREPLLFGESLRRAWDEVPPFLLGADFPSVYLEHPLMGSPFLDVTVLYGQVEVGDRVASPAAGEHGAMIDWFARAQKDHDNISCGFELDTKESPLPTAAIHFQPRFHQELVRPFCETIGEPERANLYLDLAERMPDGWPLSFFGMFRGRTRSPLRVCGYLDLDEKAACAQDPRRLAEAFEAIGFRAYDDAMLDRVSALMAAAPGTMDFQFDIMPDGRLGGTFAIDVQFGIEQPEVVRANFEHGAGARVMELLEDWGIVDERWKAAIRSAFARAIPVELDDGERGRFAFTLMPQWMKARWTDTELQPAKLYHLAQAKIVNGNGSAEAK